MNIFAEIEQRLLRALDTLKQQGTLPQAIDVARVGLEPPRDPSHGDMSTNAAMVLARDAGLKPRELAETIAALLAKEPLIETAEIAGPGFINLRLKTIAFDQVIVSILGDPAGYGRGAARQERVNVEYVSANPTGPLHVGHCRGAVFGDSLAALLTFAGYDVTREYYINDAGAQVDLLARSAYCVTKRR